MAQIIESKDNDIKKKTLYIIINPMFKEVEENKSMLGRVMETESNVFYR